MADVIFSGMMYLLVHACIFVFQGCKDSFLATFSSLCQTLAGAFFKYLPINTGKMDLTCAEVNMISRYIEHHDNKGYFISNTDAGCDVLVAYLWLPCAIRYPCRSIPVVEMWTCVDENERFVMVI